MANHGHVRSENDVKNRYYNKLRSLKRAADKRKREAAVAVGLMAPPAQRIRR